MKKIRIKKNYGILFFVTGLSGSGKSSISKELVKKIKKKYGPTFLYSGEKIRKVFSFNGYSRNDRIELGKKNINLINYILSQKINVLYDAIALLKILRTLKRKKIKNYIEIFIKADVKKIIKLNKKNKIYKARKKNIVGIHIKPEFPSNPHILIKNNYKKDAKKIASEIFLTLEKKILIK